VNFYFIKSQQLSIIEINPFNYYLQNIISEKEITTHRVKYQNYYN